MNNNDLTEKEKEWLDKLNKYSEKCKRISAATCWETDKEVAESIKKCDQITNQTKVIMKKNKLNWMIISELEKMQESKKSFVEKLTTQDFADFVKQYDYSVTYIEISNNTDVYLKLSNGSYYSQQSEMELTDFDCRVNENFDFPNEKVRTDWVNFLYEKFGEEYKTKFIDFTTKQDDGLSR